MLQVHRAVTFFQAPREKTGEGVRVHKIRLHRRAVHRSHLGWELDDVPVRDTSWTTHQAARLAVARAVLRFNVRRHRALRHAVNDVRLDLLPAVARTSVLAQHNAVQRARRHVGGQRRSVASYAC